MVGVEPEAANAMQRVAGAAGAPVTIARSTSIADGLLPVRPGDLTFAHVQAYTDEVVTVSDEAISGACGSLLRRAARGEPSGATALAALLSGAVAKHSLVAADGRGPERRQHRPRVAGGAARWNGED